MPPYVGKKALKQQKVRSEMLCLHHPVWTPFFFHSSLTVTRRWLFQEQPLLARFSLEQLKEMDEMILPFEQSELFSEYSKMMFQQELHFTELTDPSFEKISDDPLYANKFALATVMSTRKKNQMMLTKYLMDPDLELPSDDLMYPLCLYGQLVKFCAEQNLFLSDDNIFLQDMRLLVRPLLWYVELYHHRSSFVDTLLHFFAPVLNPQQFGIHAEERTSMIIELERRICCKSWEIMYEQFPMFMQVQHFNNYYDMVKNSVIGFVVSDSCFRDEMRIEFMHHLFIEQNYDLIINNRYDVLNQGMWAPVAERVNKVVEQLKIEPNSDYYYCPKCKKNRCHVESKQTRSHDEAATIFVLCLTCGYYFKAKN